MEDETYKCSSCQKQVPTGNRTMHTLVCGRHEQRLITEPAAESATTSDNPKLVPAAFRNLNGAEVAPAPLTAPVMVETVGAVGTAATSVGAASSAALPSSALDISRAALSDAVAVNSTIPRDTLSATITEEPPAVAKRAGTGEEEIGALLVECEYCELPVAAMDLDEHSQQCGGRTDVCDKCLHYVRLRDMHRHKDSDCNIASTGSAMSAALNRESEPLLAPPMRHQNDPESLWATPIAYAVGAAAAAAAMSLLIRRR